MAGRIERRSKKRDEVKRKNRTCDFYDVFFGVVAKQRPPPPNFPIFFVVLVFFFLVDFEQECERTPADKTTAAAASMEVVRAEASELEEADKKKKTKKISKFCVVCVWLLVVFHLQVQAVPPMEEDQVPPAKQSLVGEPE